MSIRNQEIKAQIEQALEAAKALINDFTVDGDLRFRKCLYTAKQLKWELCFLEAAEAAARPDESAPQEFNWFSDGIFHNLVIGNGKDQGHE